MRTFTHLALIIHYSLDGFSLPLMHKDLWKLNNKYIRSRTRDLTPLVSKPSQNVSLLYFLIIQIHILTHMIFLPTYSHLHKIFQTNTYFRFTVVAPQRPLSINHTVWILTESSKSTAVALHSFKTSHLQRNLK